MRKYFPHLAASISILGCGSYQQTHDPFRAPVIEAEKKAVETGLELRTGFCEDTYSLNEENRLEESVQLLYDRMEHQGIVFINVDIPAQECTDGFTVAYSEPNEPKSRGGIHFWLNFKADELFTSVFYRYPIKSPNKVRYLYTKKTPPYGYLNFTSTEWSLPMDKHVADTLEFMVTTSLCHFNDMSYATREENGGGALRNHLLERDPEL